MKTELRIVRTTNGYVIRGAIGVQSRARTTGGGLLDLSARPDLGQGETILGTFATRDKAEAALQRLRAKGR